MEDINCSGLIVKSYLFPSELDLEVLGRLLSDAAAKVQLVNLTVLVPHRSLVVHHELSPLRCVLNVFVP